MATDTIDELTDDEHEPEHPDDVEADDGEDVGLLVVVPDDDVAAQVHNAGHHCQARHGRHDSRRNSGSSQYLAERRSWFCGRRGTRREARALEIERDRAWIRANCE